MDGDLQNDPNDLSKMINEYEKGTDMIIGWRKNRKDNFFSKKKEYTPVIEITDSNGNVSKKIVQPEDHFRLMIDYFSEAIDCENKRKKQRGRRYCCRRAASGAE